MKKVLLAALALVPALALANPGTYVHADAGANWVDTGISGLSTFTGFAGGLGVGYLWGDNTINYGVELNGLIYPDSTTTDSGADFKINGYNISLLGVIKYTSCSTGFVAFAKAGAAYVHQKLSVSFPGASFDTTGNDIAPEVALGVGYQFNPNWEIDLTGDYVIGNSGSNNVFSNNGDFNTAENYNALVGVTYHFA
jgi:hypothetical protein